MAPKPPNIRHAPASRGAPLGMRKPLTLAALRRSRSAADTAHRDVRFGKMLLDRGGLAGFKRANQWLAQVDVLPYTLIYRGGEKVAEFAGGGIGRLQARLARLRPEGR